MNIPRILAILLVSLLGASVALADYYQTSEDKVLKIEDSRILQYENSEWITVSTIDSEGMIQPVGGDHPEGASVQLLRDGDRVTMQASIEGKEYVEPLTKISEQAATEIVSAKRQSLEKLKGRWALRSYQKQGESEVEIFAEALSAAVETVNRALDTGAPRYAHLVSADNKTFIYLNEAYTPDTVSLAFEVMILDIGDNSTVIVNGKETVFLLEDEKIWFPTTDYSLDYIAKEGAFSGERHDIIELNENTLVLQGFYLTLDGEQTETYTFERVR